MKTDKLHQYTSRITREKLNQLGLLKTVNEIMCKTPRLTSRGHYLTQTNGLVKPRNQTELSRENPNFPDSENSNIGGLFATQKFKV